MRQHMCKKINQKVNRPPKVRPKNLTIWGSVFLWQNIVYEFKLEVVHEYLNGEGSYDYLAKKHNMPALLSNNKSGLQYLEN